MQSEALARLLEFLRLQVECFALPVGEILSRVDRELLFGCGWRREEPPRSLSELFGAASSLDKESRRILGELALSFGKGYREEQVRLCDGAERQLRAHTERLRQSLEGKKRVNLTLCVAGATAFVILLM